MCDCQNKKPEWVFWRGGDCPVDFEAVVQIETSDHRYSIEVADNVNWSAKEGSDRIYVKAYRLIFG